MESVNFFEQTLKSLERQYEGKQSLNRKETAKALGIGVSTLDLKIKEGRDLPEYIKIGNAKNSRIIFPLAGLKISAYIRHVISNAKPPVHKFDKTMVIQVAKIGNNLNQIAKHVNIGKAIDSVVLRQIIDVNKKLDDLMLQKQNPGS